MWTVALVIQFWHHIEHLLLITQATLHQNLGHRPVPMSMLQFSFRVWTAFVLQHDRLHPMVMGCTITCFRRRMSHSTPHARVCGATGRDFRGVKTAA